ncbi:hypothetical protein, variant [Aphanomyces invadans]|uniref:Uncharacterized protein n=1 Tax=Aphanomyces invadans TaxID=157072 RepID=A0A024UQW9_9STRA|nr:hypothetical protein, variant [Aphanomyces invadans]ETW08003.1 hypothetical protein, variant [Aphanomyces invadans]|eukprot:XP_008864096.1 hypothetical protein, variant [Aphanomyces invadans]
MCQKPTKSAMRTHNPTGSPTDGTPKDNEVLAPPVAPTGRRRVTQQMSQEEYTKSLEEQIRWKQMRTEAETLDRRKTSSATDTPLSDATRTGAGSLPLVADAGAGHRGGRRRAHQVSHDEWLRSIQSQLGSKQHAMQPSTAQDGKPAKLSREDWIKKLEAEIDSPQRVVPQQPPPPQVPTAPLSYQGHLATHDGPAVDDDVAAMPAPDLTDPSEVAEVPEALDDAPPSRPTSSESPVRSTDNVAMAAMKPSKKKADAKGTRNKKQRQLADGKRSRARGSVATKTTERPSPTLAPRDTSSDHRSSRSSRNQIASPRRQADPRTKPNEDLADIVHAYKAIKQQNEEMKRQLAEQSHVLQLIRERVLDKPPVAAIAHQEPRTLASVATTTSSREKEDGSSPLRLSKPRRVSKLVPPGQIAKTVAMASPHHSYRTPHTSTTSNAIREVELPPLSIERPHARRNDMPSRPPQEPPPTPPKHLPNGIRSSCADDVAEQPPTVIAQPGKDVHLSKPVRAAAMWQECDELGQGGSMFFPALVSSTRAHACKETVDEQELQADSVEVLVESSTMVPMPRHFSLVQGR